MTEGAWVGVPGVFEELFRLLVGFSRGVVIGKLAFPQLHSPFVRFAWTRRITG